MTRPRRKRIAAALALAALALTCAANAQAATPSRWICNPETTPAACRSGLDATLLSPSGAVRGVERARAARRPKVDCFYVYPTVSDQPRPVATLRIDPQQRAVVLFQAQRFRQACRLFAPLYRQLTLRGITDVSKVTGAQLARGYGDVRAAWREYLRRWNRGRGVVLIGHSQGSFVLRQLIREQIDGRADARARLVSALLIGGQVTVKQGGDRGGDFASVPACRAATQTGCVVAYSAFNGPVPESARFGRVDGGFDAGRGPGLEILCTNPAALGGGAGPLRAYNPTAPFPGTIGAGTAILLGALPKVRTPWIAQCETYTGRCVNEGGANVLQVETAPGGRVLRPVPDAAWGIHLADVNIALGNLVDLVRRQAAAYARR